MQNHLKNIFSSKWNVENVYIQELTDMFEWKRVCKVDTTSWGWHVYELLDLQRKSRKKQLLEKEKMTKMC